MMIANISLVVIFLCAFFIVVCSILNKIQLYPSTKGILCISMLSIIGVLSGDFHNYSDVSLDIVLSSLCFLIIRQTCVAYKRGFM